MVKKIGTLVATLLLTFSWSSAFAWIHSCYHGTHPQSNLDPTFHWAWTLLGWEIEGLDEFFWVTIIRDIDTPVECSWTAHSEEWLEFTDDFYVGYTFGTVPSACENIALLNSHGVRARFWAADPWGFEHWWYLPVGDGYDTCRAEGTLTNP